MIYFKKKPHIVLVLLIQVFHAWGQDIEVPAVEATYRDGLPNFFGKINQEKVVKIAYLGGSITRADNGWRNQTFQAFQARFPSVRFEQIMAAIGGTGSDFGAYRLQNHVLQHQPDLVFVEFAVNDNAKSSDKVKEAMEGIVRQIWRHSPGTDICFVYTFSKPQLEHYQRGHFPVSASAMEAVADYYQIPSICMALPAVKLIDDGEMILQGSRQEKPGTLVFSQDGVHPFAETGQKIYAETVMKHFQVLKTIGTSKKHPLKKALMPDNLQNATMVSIKEATKSSGWAQIDSVVKGKPFATLISSVYATEDTTDFIKVTFDGPSFGLVDVMGPGSGQIMVKIDNQRPRFINRFDEYCTYYRLNYTIIDGLPKGKHSALIKVSPNRLDKAAILQKRNNTMSDPAPYETHAAYIGGLLFQK